MESSPPPLEPIPPESRLLRVPQQARAGRHLDAVAEQAEAMVAKIIAYETAANRKLWERRLVLVASVNPWSRVGRKRIAVLSSPAGAWFFRKSFLRLKPLNGTGTIVIGAPPRP